MSKAKQKTLFQTWGSSSGLSQTSAPPKNQKKTGATSKQTVNSRMIKNAAEYVDLCASSEDEELILAMEESLKCLPQDGNHDLAGQEAAITWNDVCEANFGLWDDDLSDSEFENKDVDIEKNRNIVSTKSSTGSVVTEATGKFNRNCSTSSSKTNSRINILYSESNETEVENITDFDRDAGRIWIYPTNYPVREYQYNIVAQALFRNTLVTLPTGLGKTFVAAVVMYNFFRWYPAGKVIFMAPTKPLVTQQIEACHDIMGIPMEETAEMTGSLQPTERRKAWSMKRVFFLTPQVIMNDLINGLCPALDVKCVIVDEAHKALGNHAYCVVVRELAKHNVQYRMVALSATPGSDIKSVQQVLTNLLISHIELRTEDSIDIQPYMHERKVEKIVIPLGEELNATKEKYLRVIDVVVQRLRRHGVLYNRDIKSLSKFLILKARDAFRQDPPPQLSRNLFGVVEGDFAICMSLYHGYELLQLHGLRSLYNFLEGLVSGEKGVGRTRSELMKNEDFTELLEMLKQTYQPIKCADPNVTQLTQRQSQMQVLAVGHPKMAKLEEIVLEHFQKFQNKNLGETRIMIFSQYRDSVNEITEILNRHRPIVKVMSFVGHSSGKTTKGFSQKDQLKVMKQFRDGGYNTLVSTCVGEEGLDIGDVDLIICFDAHKSPVRLVQRMGRTGRKREGRIVMLVSEGKEEQVYNQSLCSKRSIHRAILNGTKSLVYYKDNPRMVPRDLNPICHRMPIAIPEYVGQNKRKLCSIKATDQAVQNQGAKRSTGKKTACKDGFLTDDELNYWSEKFKVNESEIRHLPPSSELLCLKKNLRDVVREPEKGTNAGSLISLSDWIPWQNRLQETHMIDHSLETRHMVELLEFTDLQATCLDDIYGMEMRAFLQAEDIISLCSSETKKSKDESILKFCKVNSVAESTVQHQKKGGNSLNENSLKDTGKRAKNRKKRSEEVMLDNSKSPLISVIQECDRTDFVEIISEKTSVDDKISYVESVEATDAVPLIAETVAPNSCLDSVEEFPTLSQLLPSCFTEDLLTDRVQLNTKCSFAVLTAPSIEEAIDALDEIERLDHLPTVDILQLVEEWKRERSSGAFLLNSSARESLPTKIIEADKIADNSLRMQKNASILLSSMTEDESTGNQRALRCETEDLDVAECITKVANKTIEKAGQVTARSPCWSLQLDDDFMMDFEDDNLAEGSNDEKLPCCDVKPFVSKENPFEVNLRTSHVTLNRNRFDLNNSTRCRKINSTDFEVGCFTPSPKVNRRAWFEGTGCTLVSKDKQAVSKADIYTPVSKVNQAPFEVDANTPVARVTCTSFKVSSTPGSKWNHGLFEVDASTPVAKVNCTPFKIYSTPVSNRIRDFSKVNSSTPVATANQTKVSESAPVSTVIHAPARNSFLDCFEDDIEDDLLAELVLPPPPQSPIPNIKANTTQLTFTQAMACLQESYNTSLQFNNTLEQSLNRNRNIKIGVSETTKPSVSNIQVPHFDLGFDLDDDEFEDDDVVPPSPPQPSVLSVTRKLKIVSKSNQTIGETERSLLRNSKESAGKTSEIADTKQNQKNLCSNDCNSERACTEIKGSHSSGRLLEEVGVGINSERAAKEIEGLNSGCVDDFASLDVEVIGDTQPFELPPAAVSCRFNTMEISRTGSSISAGRKELHFDLVPTCPPLMSAKSADCPLPSVTGRRCGVGDEHDRENSPLLVMLKEKVKKQLDCSYEGSGDDSFSLVKGKTKKRTAIIMSPESPAASNRFKNENYNIEDVRTPERPSTLPRKRPVASCLLSDEESFTLKSVKKMKLKQLPLDDEDDFQGDVTKLRKGLKHQETEAGNLAYQNRKNFVKLQEKKKKRCHKARAFLDEEADVSDAGGSNLSSDDEDGSDLDQMDDSFINDNTALSQSLANDSVDMHAVYMRSVRSPRVPVGGLGRYKLKDIRSLGSRMDVLSQVHEDDKMEDDYEGDSFCVGESYVEEEEDEEEECTEESFVDERSRRRKNRSKNRAEVSVKPGRRRIMQISESSGGEEDRDESYNNSAFGRTEHPVKSRCLQSKNTNRTSAVKSNHSPEDPNNLQSHQLKTALPALQERNGVLKADKTVAAKQPFSSSSNLGSSNRSLSSVHNSTTAAVNTSKKPAVPLTNKTLTNKIIVPSLEFLSNQNFQTSRLGRATTLTNQTSVHSSYSLSNQNFQKSLAGLTTKDIPTFSLGIDDLMGDLDEEDDDFSESLLSKGPPSQWTVLKSKTLVEPSDNLLTAKNCGSTVEASLQHKRPMETLKQNSTLPTTAAEKLRQDRIRLSLQKKEEFQKKFKVSPSATSQ